MKGRRIFLDSLIAHSNASMRLRKNPDLRNSPVAGSLWMMDVIALGTVLSEGKDGAYEPLRPEDILA